MSTYTEPNIHDTHRSIMWLYPNKGRFMMSTKQQIRQQKRREKHNRRRKLKRLLLQRQARMWHMLQNGNIGRGQAPWKQGACVHTMKQLAFGLATRQKRLAAKG